MMGATVTDFLLANRAKYRVARCHAEVWIAMANETLTGGQPNSSYADRI